MPQMPPVYTDRPLRKPAGLFQAAAAAVLLCAIGVGPAAAATVFDVSISQRIRGLTPEVRKEVHQIELQSRARLFAVLKKYGIDPDGPLKMEAMMKASKELEAVAKQEREAVVPLLKPEERAQYYALIDETTKKVRDAVE